MPEDRTRYVKKAPGRSTTPTNSRGRSPPRRGGGGGGGIEGDRGAGVGPSSPSPTDDDVSIIELETGPEEPVPLSVSICASLYNIFVLAGICAVVVSVGLYIMSFFYFGLQFDCTLHIYDDKIGHIIRIRDYLVVLGSVLIVLFIGKIYESIFLRLVTSDRDVLRTAKVPYYMAIIVFDIFLILGSIIFWTHEDKVKEICPHRTYKYIHDVTIVNYVTAAYLNYILYWLVIGGIKVYDYSVEVFSGPEDAV